MRIHYEDTLNTYIFSKSVLISDILDVILVKCRFKVSSLL